MKIVITGAAGFIGSNLCVHFAKLGFDVIGIDDFSRPGVRENVARLGLAEGVEIFSMRVSEFCGPSRPKHKGVDAVFHLAGQVSLASSYSDPLNDFERNVSETVALLWRTKESWGSIPVVLSSSNKVYGPLTEFAFEEKETRFASDWMKIGINEQQPTAPRGPYSLSKLCGEFYANEFSTTYGLNTVVFRKSAIAGPWQQPQNDQGWLSFLIRESLAGREVVFNGEGKQVRDVLHVGDLCKLYQRVLEPDLRPGHHVFNVGGGPERALSLRELMERLSRSGLKARWKAGPPLENDQPIFVSNSELVQRKFGWTPTRALSDIIQDVVEDQARHV